jgi:hypothetical protein
VVQGVQTGADPVGDADLGVGSLDVVADGLLADDELGGDLTVAQAARDEGEDLSLPCGQARRQGGR